LLVVADTGPLISLSLVDKLDVLDVLFGHIVIPEAVWHELEGLIVSLSIPQAEKYRNAAT
jgi:predicted nucleic acid-binding protein